MRIERPAFGWRCVVVGVCGALVLTAGLTSAATLFVSTAGSDTAGDGSFAGPYRTVARALGIAGAGDEVVLRGSPGVADNRYRESVRIEAAGVTLRSETGEWAVIECPTTDEEVDVCVTFDVDADGSRLERLEVVGGYYYGIKLETRWDWGDPDDRTGVSGITIEDCKIHGTGRDAVKITPGCDDVTIRRTEIHSSGVRDGSNAEGIDNVNGDRMLVQDCWVHDVATTGIYFKGGSTDTVVERTRVERAGGAGILIGFDTSPEYFDLVANPSYYEAIRGIVRNNIIVGTAYAGIGMYAAAEAQVWNNTIVDTARSAHSPIYFGVTFQDWDPAAGRPPSRAPVIRNNLVVQPAGAGRHAVFVRYADELGGLAALSGMPDTDYNLFHHAGGACTFTDQRPASALIDALLPQWRSHVGGEAHSVEADPLLGEDGHLGPRSPAIDAGVSAGAPDHDFDGDIRPQGAGCDIGADEVVASRSRRVRRRLSHN